MAKSSKPRKPYRPRQPGGIPGRLQPWKLDRLFTPLEAILQHIRRGGEFEVDDGDRLVFTCAATGTQYDVIYLLEAYADIFEKQRQYDPKAPATDCLYALTRGISAETVSEAEVTEAVTCVAAIRAYMGANPCECIRDAALVISLDCHMKEVEKGVRVETSEVSAASAAGHRGIDPTSISHG